MTEIELELAMQRCLHGEITDGDRQLLYGHLDQSSKGWRRLALAFVEEETWRRGCHEFICPASAEPGPAVIGQGPAKVMRFSRNSFRWTAVAGLLVALGVGYGAGHLSGRRPSEGAILGKTGGDAVRSSPSAAETPRPDRNDFNVAKVSPSRSSRRSTPVMRVSSGSTAPFTLDLPLAVQGDDVQSVEIPVVKPSSIRGDSRPQIRNILTASERQKLEQLGFRLNRERQLISVPLPNGESVVVPVDSYGVRYLMQ